jgi:hypothetical protein
MSREKGSKNKGSLGLSEKELAITESRPVSEPTYSAEVYEIAGRRVSSDKLTGAERRAHLRKINQRSQMAVPVHRRYRQDDRPWPHEAPVDGPPRQFLARAWRGFEQAAQTLNDATEADDIQAVGMRCRECLVSFVQEAASEATILEGTEPPRSQTSKRGQNCWCRSRRRAPTAGGCAASCARCRGRPGTWLPG